MLTKTLAIAGIIGTAIVGGGLAVSTLKDTNVQVCTEKGCNTYTKDEYKQAKTFLADKYLNGTEMTYDEYQAFVGLLNHEIKQKGKLEIANFKGDEAKIKQAAYDLMTK